MKRNFEKKANIYPQVVFVISTYNEDNSANAMVAAWGCQANYDEIFIVLDKTHKTTKNILKTKSLVVSIGTKQYVSEIDYLGMVSGNQVKNKLEKVNFTTSKSKYVNAPIIDELPLSFECELESYDEEKEFLVAKVKNVLVDDSILTDSKIDITKLEPLSFDGFNSENVIYTNKIAPSFKIGAKYLD